MNIFMFILLTVEFTNENITVLNQANFSFDLSVADIYYTLFNGHTLVGLKNTDNYEKILEIIKNENINLMVVTPTFIKLLLLDNSFNSKNFNMKSLELKVYTLLLEEISETALFATSISSSRSQALTSALLTAPIDSACIRRVYCSVRFSTYADDQSIDTS